MRIMLPRPLFLVALLFALVLPAAAFVVEGPRKSGISALEHLATAPRWANSDSALLQSGERGLGGGLEYVVDDSICRMNFVDGANCAARSEAIRDALDQWASGHPSIWFVDVTGQIAPSFPLAAAGETGQGSEIDFFASTAEEFPVFRNSQTTGYTLFYERPQASMELTNGNVLSGPIGVIESADVRLNADRCYYLDAAQAVEQCVHFPSLLLHEISHALGIGHPEEKVHLNLDTDQIPGNEIVIDCDAPSNGLMVATEYDGAAVAHGQDVQGPGRWRRGLTWDDVAARDALYPNCDIERIERAKPRWGAFALAADGAMGVSQFARTADLAREDALAKCSAAEGTVCRVVSSFNGCFAFATNVEGAFGHALASRSDHARVDAVIACSEAGDDCRVAVDFCAYE